MIHVIRLHPEDIKQKLQGSETSRFFLISDELHRLSTDQGTDQAQTIWTPQTTITFSK